jgi:lambda repressor-like predicted transcriptional regulator
MEHNNNERRLTRHTHQQAIQTWSMEFIDNVELVASIPPALSALGLGQAATYLETHPEYLVAALKHSNWTIRAAAVQVQGKRGKSVEPLLNALDDENVSVRATAARALGTRGKDAPLEPLVEALKDREWQVRTAATMALGRLKNRTPVEPLLSVLHDENASVRAAAVWTLGTLGEQAPIEPLVIALQDKAWAVREAAAMALHEQGERAPVGYLLAARWDEDSSVRMAVDNALEERFDEQKGEKIVPVATNWQSSSWIRLALAVLSVGSLISLTSLSTNNSYIGRAGLISQLAATFVICLAIALINILYHRKPSGIASIRKQTHQQSTSMPLHNAILAGASVLTLTQIAYSLLMQIGFAYDPTMTTDTVHFILICRLITLGIMVTTVIVINTVFFMKH